MGEFLEFSDEKLLKFLTREAQRKAASILAEKKDNKED